MAARIPPGPVLLIALALPLLSTIPTWQGYRFQSPPQKVFMGFRHMAADHYQYASLMRQAQDENRFLMENRYTTEPQKGVYVFLYYWLLGNVARLAGASLPAVWQAFRLLGGFLYVLLFWSFAAYYVEDRRRRLLATVIFSFAGGLDWIVTALRAAGLQVLEPLEYPYGYYWNWCTFGTMLVPNWIWPGMLMMMAGHILLARPRWWCAATFALPPVIWLSHHHTAMVVYLTFGLLPVMPALVAAARLEKVPWDRVRANLRLALPAILSFAPVAVYLLWARTDTVFRLNAANSFKWTVFFSVWWYPLSYGLLLPLAWYGLRDLSREKSLAADLNFAWLSASFYLSVNPLAGGAKYQYLVFPPLAILAARGLYHLLDRSEAVRRAAASTPAAAAFILLLFLNAPVSLMKDLASPQAEPDMYASAAEIEAMKWLDRQPPGAVLCAYRTGHLIPWLARKKVYVGHWFMTLELGQKTNEISRFFSPYAPGSVRRDVLRKSEARYVFYGPNEARMGAVDLALPLTRIYGENGVSIYEVTGPL